MVELVLKPSLESFDRPALEAFREEARNRRMLAAVVYHQGKNAKLAHESDKVRRKLKAQIEILGKEIITATKADTKLADRLDRIYTLEQEIGLLSDLQQIIPEAEDGSDT